MEQKSVEEFWCKLEKVALTTDERINKLECAFRSSIMEASNDSHLTFETLCDPLIVTMVTGVARWAVTDGGKFTNGGNCLNCVDKNTRDVEGKPAFLICVNLAKLMRVKIADVFMNQVVDRFCSPTTIGQRNNLNHMQNFADIWYFSVAVLCLVLRKLNPLIGDEKSLMVDYLRHPPTSRCFTPTACMNLFEYLPSPPTVYVLQGVPIAPARQLKSIVVPLLLEHVIRGSTSISNPCLLATTREFNFETIHEAVLRGKINMDLCSFDSKKNISFLCFLMDSPNIIFRKILDYWLPMCTIDHASITINYMVGQFINAWKLIDRKCNKTSVKNAKEVFGDEYKWRLLLKRADPYQVLNIDIAMMAIKCHFYELFKDVVRRASFSPVALKKIYIFSATNSPAIKHLLSNYSWLAKTYVTSTNGTLLHHAIENNLPWFNLLLKIPEIEKNINNVNGDGLTPLQVACYRRRVKYFKALINAGADLSVVTEKGETIFHLLSNISTYDMLYALAKWAKSSDENRLRLPDIEIRETEGNLTALQLSIHKDDKLSLAKLMIQEFEASFTSLFGTFAKISSLDYLILTNHYCFYKLYFIKDEHFYSSFGRILSSYINDSLELPITSWPIRYRKRFTFFGSQITKETANDILYEVFLKKANEDDFVCNGSLAGMQNLDLEHRTCPICLDTFVNYHQTLCGHRFHSKCFAQWNHKSSNCPVCKASDQPPVPILKSAYDNFPPIPKQNEREVKPPSVFKDCLFRTNKTYDEPGDELNKGIHNFDGCVTIDYFIDEQWVNEIYL